MFSDFNTAGKAAWLKLKQVESASNRKDWHWGKKRDIRESKRGTSKQNKNDFAIMRGEMCLHKSKRKPKK